MPTTTKKTDREEMLAKLDAPPPPEALCHRTQGRATLTYIEGWWVIDQANAIFGPDGWHRQFCGNGLREVWRGEKAVEGRTRYDLAMLCEYEIVATTCTAQDVGYGIGQSYTSYADAFESAAKEAVTDALKRCLRTWGNRFGNCLYDKTWLANNGKGNPPPKDNPPPNSNPPPEGSAREEAKKFLDGKPDKGAERQAFEDAIDAIVKRDVAMYVPKKAVDYTNWGRAICQHNGFDKIPDATAWAKEHARFKPVCGLAGEVTGAELILEPTP